VPIDQAEIDGDLRSVLEELLLRMKVVNSSEMHTASEFKEQIRPKYPEIALREILLNAIVHRNYESTTPIRVSVFPDRIEITSPGGLYGEVNRLNFRTQSSYRNPVIAESLKILGFVNRFGYGLRRAERALLDGGSRPLDFTIEDGAILVTIWALGAI
jgi:ATP-dependent DNA helicase RecG